MVKLFDTIMIDIVENKITDLHIDPTKDAVILRKHKTKFKSFTCDASRLYEYLKFQAKINLESYTNLQTGQFSYIVDDTEYYLRFAVLENETRRHGVLRILNIIPISNLEACSMNKEDVLSVRSMFKESHGLLLFCGKTGAGKSTTMFAGLNEVKDKEIFTLENPIEKVYDHMIQIKCEDHDLNKHISQLLRHDPDILVIGEIRTSIELQQAIRASLSGHLIVSTLHAGNIDEVLLRLQDLQLSAFELKSVLVGIVFQKIVKKESLKFEFEVLDKKQLELKL